MSIKTKIERVRMATEKNEEVLDSVQVKNSPRNIENYMSYTIQFNREKNEREKNEREKMECLLAEKKADREGKHEN